MSAAKCAAPHGGRACDDCSWNERSPAGSFDIAAALADRDLVERSMNDLTLDHRAVIVLRFYLDLPVEEVARILDIPAGTVKSRIHRGLAVLRAHLTATGGSAAGHPRERTA